MSVDPTISAPDSTVATADSIFSLVVHNESFFSDIGSLPDIRGFLSEHANELREVLIERWQTILGSSALPLVVNILINPNIFFSHRDAVRGQYHKYFRPIYLDRNAIAIDEGSEVDDPPASIVVNFHREFDDHYRQALHGRASFISLNDIEASLYAQGDKSPFPAANTVVSISQTGGYLDEPNYSIVLDGDRDYKDHVLAKAHQSRLKRAPECLYAYLEMITGHRVSYHHVTIGSQQTWLGRLYLAFRNRDALSDKQEWIAGVKTFALESITQLASAGTLIRNKHIIEMLTGVRTLLTSAEKFKRMHERTVSQFAESAAAAKRKQLPSHDEVEMSLSSFTTLQVQRLTSVHRHVTTEKCIECIARMSGDLPHALKGCISAGEAFVSDILRMVDGAFEPLPHDSKEFLAHSLAFGIIGDRDRPKAVSSYFDSRYISGDWRLICGSQKCFRNLPPEIVPHVRALVLMAGNAAMVKSNIERLKLTLSGSPRLAPPTLGADELIIKVQHPITGVLHSTDRQTLDLPPLNELGHDRARLLLHFGLEVFDAFEMCIATATADKLVTSMTAKWKGAPASTDGFATYAFQISI